MNPTLHRCLALTLLVGSALTMGCGSKPPPCAANGPSCISWPRDKWPEHARKVQLAEEWSVHHAQRAYLKLPEPVAAQFKTQYSSALDEVHAADKRFVEAVDAAPGESRPRELTVLDHKLTELVLLLQKMQKAASATEMAPADQQLLASDVEKAREQLSTLQFLAKN